MSTMLAAADVMHFLADEFASLGCGPLAFSAHLTRSFEGLLFRHKNLLPVPTTVIPK
jgi:hypothetical protein